jgi:hypothetical protein
VGLIQRVLDEAGLCTLSITQVPEIAAIIKPSRSLFVGHPFGLTFGDLGGRDTQAAVIDAMLDAAQTMDSAGIRATAFTWTKDDERYRQLRKIK